MTITGAHDAALIGAIVSRGSALAARQLVDRHSPRLLAVAARMLGGDIAAAEDALQIAWVNAIKALPHFRGDAQFPTWMTRIVMRAALDELRRHHDVDTSEDAGTTAAAAAPYDDVDARIDTERLLARLPPGCRAVLIAHDLEGFTHEEIAATLHIAPGTSRAHLFRARRLLRGWLTHQTVQEIPR